MAHLIKIAATGRRCEALPENAAVSDVDEAVITYLNTVFHPFELLEPTNPLDPFEPTNPLDPFKKTNPLDSFEPARQLDRFERAGQLVQGEKQKPDLIVLPEMCDLPDGFEMDTYVRYIQNRTKAIEDFIRKKAVKLNAWIAYPTVRILEDQTLRNSCIMIDRQGRIVWTYDKLHPTQGELEAGILPGESVKVLECELGRIGAAICFDLNYTVHALEYKEKEVDILLFPSLFHGGVQKQLWAYTARAYLIGASGGIQACVVLPSGEVLQESEETENMLVCTINLDFELVHLDFNTEKLKALAKQEQDRVKIQSLNGLGSVLLINEDSRCSMKQRLSEFQIETLDDYLKRMEDAAHNSVLPRKEKD